MCVFLTFLSYFLLNVEIDGVVIVTRYLNQLKREKGAARAARMDTENAFQLKHRNRNGYSYARLPEPVAYSDPPPLQPYHLEPSDIEFDPYTENGMIPTRQESRFSRETSPAETRDGLYDAVAMKTDNALSGRKHEQ